jgi:hypothetical protein
MERDSLKERFILIHDFRGFSTLSDGSFVSGPVVRQYIMAEREW